MISNFSISKIDSSLEMNSSSEPSKMSVSNSVRDPKEMCKKCINSFFPFRAAPSAMLTGIDTDALLICETSPNFSSAGKSLVTRYISFTNSKLFIQQFNCLWGFIANKIWIKVRILFHFTNDILHLTSNFSQKFKKIKK